VHADRRRGEAYTRLGAGAWAPASAGARCGGSRLRHGELIQAFQVLRHPHAPTRPRPRGGSTASVGARHGLLKEAVELHTAARVPSLHRIFGVRSISCRSGGARPLRVLVASWTRTSLPRRRVVRMSQSSRRSTRTRMEVRSRTQTHTDTHTHTHTHGHLKHLTHTHRSGPVIGPGAHVDHGEPHQTTFARRFSGVF